MKKMMVNVIIIFFFFKIVFKIFKIFFLTVASSSTIHCYSEDKPYLKIYSRAEIELKVDEYKEKTSRCFAL